jgi:phosphoribosyl transferase-like protein
MANVERALAAWDGVLSCRVYHSYRSVSGALNPAFRKDSDGRLLDFKAGGAEALAAEVEELGAALDDLEPPPGSLLSVLPGHRARESNADTPLARLADCLSRRDSRLRVSVDTLIRCRDVAKLATGGDRSLEIQVASMRVADAARVAGATVVVLDDIVSSGQSMAAARELLMRAGAARVACVAIARTFRVAR